MYLLVGNPSAQSGRNADRIDEARRVMDRLGLRHDFLATRPGGLTVQDVSRALRGGAYQVVISMGGDGTFHEVAKGLLASGSDVPMGMLPTGTANDQGRSFGLSSNRDELERNVATIAAGHLTPCDAGRVTAFDLMDQPLGTNWFFDSIGWGISARTLRMRNEDRQLVAGVPILREVYRDQLVYAGALLRSFLASYIDEQKFEVEVETDDGRTLFLDGLTDLVIKNTRIYAGAWVLDPSSLPDDGEMELVPFRGRQEWIARAIATLDGLPVKPPVESVKELSPVVRARRFELRIHDRPMGEPVEAQLDGEEWVTAARWQVETVRHAIRLVVPENPAPSRFFGLFG
jgi:diacylglycerol kinase family enzyme